MISPENLTEEQRLQKQISAMFDSVNLINKLIEEGEHTDQIHDNIDRNFRHLEIMLEKDNIKNSDVDLTPFEDAIIAGKEYVESST
jgi:hypothetical protein